MEEVKSNEDELMQQEQRVVMSNDLWITLSVYIQCEELARKAEIEQTEEFSFELNEDGTPKYQYAEQQAQYYREREVKLQKILELIEEREVCEERRSDEEKVLEV